MIEQYFASIPKGNKPIYRPDIIEPPLGGEVRDTVFDNIQLPAVIQTYRIPAQGTEDYYAVSMLATLLSGGESSRLYKALVDEQQKALFVGAIPLGLEDPGATIAFGIANMGVLPEDVEAARLWDGYFIRWFNDPLFGLHYPANMVALYETKKCLPHGLDFVQAGDMEAIAVPLDFIGVNNYTRQIMSGQISLNHVQTAASPNPNASYTEMDWEVYPNSLYDTLNRLHFHYHAPKIYVTENGCSYSDGPDGNGRIADQRRVDYFQGYLAGVHQAIGNGVPVAGYFIWSFMDNFEWARGYSQRFGIVYVDYQTQQRLPKDSAYWYKDVIKHNRLKTN